MESRDLRRRSRRLRIAAAVLIIVTTAAAMAYFTFTNFRAEQISPDREPEPLKKSEARLPKGAERFSQRQVIPRDSVPESPHDKTTHQHAAIRVSLTELDSIASRRKSRIPDRAADFPGGIPALENYFSHLVNCRMNNGVHNPAVLRLTIKANGFPSDPAVVTKGLPAGCADELRRRTVEMPAWNPAIREGLQSASRVEIKVWFPAADD